MEQDKIDPEKLNIRCPSCRVRFYVDTELMNRIVECGACDFQFRITDEVIIHSKKVNTGAKRELEPNQFRRIPLDSTATSTDIQTVNYADFKHPEQLGPTSPQRLIAGAFGCAIMLFGALLLLIASKPGNAFGGMTFEKKLIIAGFTSLLGFVFLLYANPRAKFKAGVFALLLAAGVFAIPIFVKGNASMLGKNLNPPSEFDLLINGNNAVDPILALRERFITHPLENEQKRLEATSSNKKAYGIYLTNMLDRNKLTARDYLVRETSAGESSHTYPRNDRNYLLILTETEMSFDEVAAIANALGEVTETHSEINLMVLRVDNDVFVAGSTEELNNTSHPKFYTLNLSELGSIDIERVKEAVDRLANSDAKILRPDIGEMLINLLDKPGITFHDAIARALLKWSDDPGLAAKVGLKVLKSYDIQKTSPPEHLVRLVADQKDPAAIPTIVSIWENNTVIWDKELVKFGPLIEALVIERISSDQQSLRRAAIKMLGNIGTQLSLPALRKALSDENPEIRLLSERAIQLIEQR